MAHKQYTYQDLTLHIYKRAGSRNIRLSITPTGTIRITIPKWAPYQMGVDFAKSKYDWIKKQVKPRQLLMPDQPIGKAHHLRFLPVSSSKIATQVVKSEVRISYPSLTDWQHPDVQAKAEAAAERALKVQSEQLLPQRLDFLAKKYDFHYRNMKVKKLKSRWGSCDSNKDIVLNIFLMQLPWDCIDYVILHELTHTEIMRHGADFWNKMQEYMPNAKEIRKKIRKYQPIIDSLPHQPVA
jgi:predicted metal-dependent hydrolase